MLIIISCAIIAVVIIAVLVSMNIQSASARKSAGAEKVESKDLIMDPDPSHETAPAAEVERTEEAPHSRMEKRKSRSKIDDDSYRNALQKIKKTETAAEKEPKAGDEFYRNALKSINDKKDQ
ncbi:hypothetical protein [Metabacillus sp. RGM 3146]|uniref:hypothetical protein n=1 Tax=Metabacillus sp. RGM 3146 TaxID=3401092 RepID=UPI003B9C18E5